MSLVRMEKGVLCLAVVLFLELPRLYAVQSSPITENDQVATIELEQANRSPKWWRFPVSRPLPIVEPLAEKLGERLAKFPFGKRAEFEGLPEKPISFISAHRIYSLQDCIQIAMMNDDTLKTARKQIELALAKLTEAKRALFPNATLRSAITEGKTRTAPFEEKEFIFRLEQPLLDGGGLKATLNQAQVNLEIARSQYDKVLLDLRFEVEKNYYELAKLLLQLDVQRGMLKEAEPILDLAKKELDAEVITLLEYLNVQTLQQQLLYQYHSAEKDIQIAQMNLQHTLTVSADPKILIDYQLAFPEFKKNLEECQRVAILRRPEVLINYLLVKFHKYGKKIGEAKKRWKVDLAASYGTSASAFEGEDLSFGDDFFVGMQVSRPIGIHSLTSSYTSQQTAPKLGQSDRTESTAISSEAGLFNQYGGIAEEKELEVSYRQAVDEFKKIKKSVQSEVSQAYFNGEKSAMLYEAQKQKLEFRQKGIAVIDLQQKINEAMVSQVLEARIQLAQEQIALVSALADYCISLAGLNQATGYSL